MPDPVIGSLRRYEADKKMLLRAPSRPNVAMARSCSVSLLRVERNGAGKGVWQAAIADDLIDELLTLRRVGNPRRQKQIEQRGDMLRRRQRAQTAGDSSSCCARHARSRRKGACDDRA